MDAKKEIITDSLENLWDWLLQEIAGENEGFLQQIIREYGENLSRISWKEAQHWCKWSEEGPVLMPDHTRIYYRKGSVEIVLQEFQPQVKLLKFTNELYHKKHSEDIIPDEQGVGVCHCSLALPYVVFIFKFTEGFLSKTKCIFSDRPLKRLKESPLKPYFPNIDTSLTVCHGADFDKTKLEQGNITQQIAYTLDHFWQATFSNEWSKHYWEYKKHFKQKDPRLSSLQNWQEATLENPLFVIDDVEWLPYNEETFGDIIVDMMSDDSEACSFNHAIYNSVIHDFLKDINKGISGKLASIKEETINRLSEKLVKVLNKEMT